MTTLTSYAAIQARNRGVLVQSLKAIIGRPGDTVLHVGLTGSPPACGAEKSYRTFEDIPEESDPCSCGDPTHWFIKYEE